jgi:hypothetical protein
MVDCVRHLRHPPPQVREDAPDDLWILDSSAISRIGPLHFVDRKGGEQKKCQEPFIIEVRCDAIEEIFAAEIAQSALAAVRSEFSISFEPDCPRETAAENRDRFIFSPEMVLSDLQPI